MLVFLCARVADRFTTYIYRTVCPLALLETACSRCMAEREVANRPHGEASCCLKNGTRYSSKYKACDFLTPENLHFLL